MDMETVFGNNDNSSNNRVIDAVLPHIEQETRFAIDNRTTNGKDSSSLELIKGHYENVLNTYSKKKDLNPAEKDSLNYLKNELGKIESKLSPTLLNRILYSPIINTAINWLLGNHNKFSTINGTVSNLITKTSQERNLQNIQKSMRENGFIINTEVFLKKILPHNFDSFDMRYKDVKASDAEFILRFKKIPGTDAYYFQKFSVLVTPVSESPGSNTKSYHKEFYLNQPIRFTAQEAANLAKNRPVLKRENGKEVWYANAVSASGLVKQPFFNLETELSKLNIKEMENPAQKDALLKGLKSGSLRETTIAFPDGREEKITIGVRQDAKALNIYNSFGEYIDLASITRRNQMAQKILAKSEAVKNDETIIYRHPRAKVK